jgi:serine protease Do
MKQLRAAGVRRRALQARIVVIGKYRFISERRLPVRAGCRRLWTYRPESALSRVLLGLLLVVGMPGPWARSAEPEKPSPDKLAAKPAEKPAAKPIDLQRIFLGGEPASLAELKAMERHQQQLVAKVAACTVGIVVGPAHGSGVIVSEDGYVLTAAHVAGEPHRKALFILPDGKRVRGESLGIYRTLDAGLMKITDSGPWPHSEMAKGNDLRVGQWCVATGHPGGFEQGRTPVVRIGRVIVKDKLAITTDCTLVGGDSGGPLFDMQGRVIGINSRIGRFLTANMHVPIAAYHDVWERLVKGDAWGNMPGTGPYLGIQGDPKSEAAKVLSVSADSPAAKAGLQAGDVVAKFGGQPVKDFAALQMFVNDSKPGDKVALEVARGGKTVTVEVVIGQRREEK